MADSFEKRQRQRRKQEKRQQKLARKQERKDTPGSSQPEFITLEEMLGEDLTEPESEEGDENEDDQDRPRGS